MPDFYEKMKNRLRTAEQGADTLVWLSMAQSVKSEQNGQFYLGMFICTVIMAHTFSTS